MKTKLLSKFYALFVLSFLMGLSGYAQEKSISGTIKASDSGSPIPGVNVVVKGTQKGTSTDFDGNFTLNAKPSDSLQISYIGFTSQTLYVGNKTTFTITLEPNNEKLSEVVVVGYGKQKKETVTGAISSIETKELKQSPAANLAVSLAGRLPGLTAIQRSGQPGNDLTQLYIRGQGTINAQSPIVLVDGVERDLNYIDPNEVESVTILKDASSTAIFGVRGANGVILVTTKRGTSEVPRISVSGQAGAQAFTRKAHPVNSYQFAKLRNLTQNNDGGGDAYNQKALDGYRTGSDRERYPNTNWYDMLVKDYSLQQRYNLNISGKGKNVGYFVNAGYLNQGGQFKTQPESKLGYDPEFKLDRYNFRSNIDIKLNSTLKAFLNLAGYVEKANSPDQTGGEDASILLAYIYDEPANIPGPLGPDGGVVTESTVANPPYGLLNRTGYRNNTHSNITATYGMEQQLDFLTEGLSAKAVMSFDSESTNNVRASKSYRTVVQVIDQANDSIYYKPFSSDEQDSPLSRSRFNNFQSLSNFKGYLNYDRSFGKHDVTGLILYQQQKRIVNSQLPFNLRGWSTRLTYAYDHKYFAEFNAGYNGSEQFAPGRRYGFFPAVSAGWIISKENFWPKNDFVDRLKLRGSYGEVGNDRIGNQRFLYLDDISYGGGGFSGSLGLGNHISVSRLKNEELQWEVAKKLDLAVELGLFNSLNISFDYFHEKRDNVLRQRGTVPVLNGLPISALPPVNIGRVKNQGYELEVNYRKAFNQDFSITSRLNVSYAHNKQTFADEPLLPEDYAYRYREQGYRIGQNFGYVVDKYFENDEEIANSPVQNVGGHESRPGDFKYKDLNGDGKVNEKDIAPIGYSAVPEYTYGLALATTFKDFDFSFLFQGVGHVSNFYQSRGVFPSKNYFQQHLHSWTAERAANGEKISYPRLTRQPSPNEIANSYFIQDASYLRLKNVEIGYTLPKRLSKKIGATKVRFFANGLNVITWDRLRTDNFDPEIQGTTAYPITKLYNIGLNLNF